MNRGIIGSRPLQAIHFFQLLAASLGAFGGWGPYDVAIDKILQLGDFFLLLLVMLPFSLQSFALVGYELRIVAGIVDQRLVVKIVNVGDYAI